MSDEVKIELGDVLQEMGETGVLKSARFSYWETHAYTWPKKDVCLSVDSNQITILNWRCPDNDKRVTRFNLHEWPEAVKKLRELLEQN